MNKSPVITDIRIKQSINSSPKSCLSSPSPEPLTPNTQEDCMIKLCYAPPSKPLKDPKICFKKIRL